ncbi:hypothetical protein FACS1894122_07290 [Alphaproteobacteria bacterium]|nr:hypothetical protein FACS1894122_07290 [Alphaproteobacteria bacterium]
MEDQDSKIKLGKEKISLDIPSSILARLDAVRKEKKHTRTAWIMKAILEKLANDLKK